MSSNACYCFADINLIIVHPNCGQFQQNGSNLSLKHGVDTITRTMSTEKTSHLVAADGRVLPSKVLSNNGIYTINIQQDSDFHIWLVNVYNFLLISPTNMWAAGRMFIASKSTGEQELALGISFQKMADKNYAAQAQNASWSLMATDIHSVGLSSTIPGLVASILNAI